MAIEMNKSPSVRLTPVQEIKLAKPATELYVGQILKTVVVTALTNDQVLININGQNLNAQSSHHFIPGELLEVKVIANADQTVLEVQHPHLSSSILQNTLLLTLPKQAPPTSLINTLSQLAHFENLPESIQQQIAGILNNFVSIAELPQQLGYAINQSGLFFESALLKWQRGMNPRLLRTDFKGQCLRLLKSLPAVNKKNSSLLPNRESPLLEQDPLPLPGAIPQPLPKDSVLYLLEQSPEELQSILAEQLTQVLARITASQINHLSQGSKEGYFIMLDLPIRTLDSIDVIPLMIKQHQAEPMQPSKWCLSFALSLSRLGDMQATVALYSNNVDIKINAQKPDTIDILNEYQQEIGALLSKSGLNLHHWKLQLGLENNHIDVPNLRLLDIRI
nr:flagellar hook-length control protein FliK [Legionella maioricensis]